MFSQYVHCGQRSTTNCNSLLVPNACLQCRLGDYVSALLYRLHKMSSGKLLYRLRYRAIDDYQSLCLLIFKCGARRKAAHEHAETVTAARRDANVTRCLTPSFCAENTERTFFRLCQWRRRFQIQGQWRWGRSLSPNILFEPHQFGGSKEYAYSRLHPTIHTSLHPLITQRAWRILATPPRCFRRWLVSPSCCFQRGTPPCRTLTTDGPRSMEWGEERTGEALLRIAN